LYENKYINKNTTKSISNKKRQEKPFILQLS